MEQYVCPTCSTPLVGVIRGNGRNPSMLIFMCPKALGKVFYDNGRAVMPPGDKHRRVRQFTVAELEKRAA